MPVVDSVRLRAGDLDLMTATRATTITYTLGYIEAVCNSGHYDNLQTWVY